MRKSARISELTDRLSNIIPGPQAVNEIKNGDHALFGDGVVAEFAPDVPALSFQLLQPYYNSAQIMVDG